MIAVALLGGPALAQDPGYEILEHRDVVVEHLQDLGVANRVVRLTVGARAQVEGRLGTRLPAKPYVVVAPNDREFSRRYELNAGSPPGGHILAAAFPGRDLIIIRQSGLREGSDSGLERTFEHELAHLALGALEKRRGRQLEQWLNEGLAEWAAGRTPTGQEASALSGWARFGQLEPFSALANRFPAHGEASGRAYTQSMAFLCWINDEASVRDLVKALELTPDTDAAFRQVLGRDALSVEIDWVEELKEDHSLLKTILYSLNVWSVTALLALLAIGRHVVVTRRKKREMLEQELAEEAAAERAAERADEPPGEEL